jgi:hypothetical protein
MLFKTAPRIIILVRVCGGGGGCQPFNWVCLHSDGGIRQIVVTHCSNQDEAIRQAYEISADCDILEVADPTSDCILWRGSRDEAFSRINCH